MIVVSMDNPDVWMKGGVIVLADEKWELHIFHTARARAK